MKSDENEGDKATKKDDTWQDSTNLEVEGIKSLIRVFNVWEKTFKEMGRRNPLLEWVWEEHGFVFEYDAQCWFEYIF